MLKAGAVFSPCGTWRYVLYRRFSQEVRRIVTFCLLNPSTATANVNDPTIKRCIEYSKLWGFDLMYIANIFAFRSTDPKNLKGHLPEYVIGPHNDRFLRGMALKSEFVVAGWGKDGKLYGRGKQVIDMLTAINCNVMALHVNGDGTPGHPLYLKGDLVPKKLLNPVVA